MLLFLHGPETYLARSKLKQIADKARTQGIDESAIIEVDGAEATVAAARETIQAASLLSAKRLVVLHNWLLNRSPTETEELLAVLQKVPEQTIVVVAEFGEPDRRLTGFKQLSRLADKAWHFPVLDDTGLRRWLTNQARLVGATLEPAAATALLLAVGPDLWALSSELDKLATAAGDKPVTETLIAELVTVQTPKDIFGLVDALGQRDVDQAMVLLIGLRESGEPALRTFAMVVRQYRILIGVKDLTAHQQPDAAMARQLGLHPFVVRKARAQAKLYADQELRALYVKLGELDGLIKTGRRDPAVALELFIVEACRQPAIAT